jgi:radical SAM superfamily enzyme
VKLHNLHVLENTPLADDYRRGEYEPISLEEYAERVTIFLQHLNPEIYVHRLAAVASRGDEIVAPKWAALRMQTHQFILDHMKAKSARQGEFYG